MKARYKFRSFSDELRRAKIFENKIMTYLLQCNVCFNVSIKNI